MINNDCIAKQIKFRITGQSAQLDQESAFGRLYKFLQEVDLNLQNSCIGRIRWNADLRNIATFHPRNIPLAPSPRIQFPRLLPKHSVTVIKLSTKHCNLPRKFNRKIQLYRNNKKTASVRAFVHHILMFLEVVALQLLHDALVDLQKETKHE